MRTVSVLVLACCFAIALSLPKRHTTTHAAKKIVQEVDNDLDFDEDLAVENAAEEDDDNALEEENDNEEAPEFEEEQEAKDDDDSDQALEESDDAVDTRLEEEEERVTRVDGDITNLKRALEESELSPKMRKIAKENLNKIRDDVHEYTTANAHRKVALKEAIEDRVKAFKLMVDDSKAAPELEEEEDAVVRVEDDVKQLEEAIAASKLSRSTKKEAHHNLESIGHDAEEYHEAKSPEAKKLLREAIQKRMKALHVMLEEHPHHEISSAAVKADVEHIKSSLKSAHLTTQAKKAVRDNLSHILKDAEELQSAPEARREKLSEALKLRSKALKLQLEEEDN